MLRLPPKTVGRLNSWLTKMQIPSLSSVIFFLCLHQLMGCATHQTHLNGDSELLRTAELLEKKEDYQGALHALETYLMLLQADANREHRIKELNYPVQGWNPFFYALKAGDLALKLEQPESAMSYYALAHSKGMKQSFLSDRLRLLARWHEERDQPNCALKILDTYLTLDPVLFNLVADRVAKESIESGKDSALADSCPYYGLLEQFEVRLQPN